ncbi:MAG: hypothetical protein K6F44_01790 [Lachnospiraceae bacterium]|nr:hypothetical protein [Lachnospiraceae bacterium]
MKPNTWSRVLQGNSGGENSAKEEQSTIFDDVFMTICERMPILLIPLINEAFGMDYSEDEEIIPLRDEHHLPEKKIITDAYIRIRKDKYHIECQSNDHVCMITRMFEYDTVIALESKLIKEDCVELEYPASCVVYLRGIGKTGRKKVLRLKFPDGSVCEYRPDIIEVAAYSLDEMFDKKLLLMLPFYLVRYEDVLNKNDPDSADLQTLLNETKQMIDCINGQTRASVEFDVDLVDLIKKIADYLCRTADRNKERLGEVMGGKVLELASDRLKAEGRMEGRAEGRMEGRAEGRMEGRAEGRMEGRAELCCNLIIKGMISYEEASLASGLPIEDLKKAVDAVMNSK